MWGSWLYSTFVQWNYIFYSPFWRISSRELNVILEYYKSFSFRMKLNEMLIWDFQQICVWVMQQVCVWVMGFRWALRHIGLLLFLLEFDDVDKSEDDTISDLLLWALLEKREDLAELFWLRGTDHLRKIYNLYTIL